MDLIGVPAPSPVGLVGKKRIPVSGEARRDCVMSFGLEE